MPIFRSELRAVFNACGAVILLSASMQAISVDDEYLKLNSRADLVSQDVSGSGKDSSYLDDGLHLLLELDLRQKQRLDSGLKSKLNLNLRITDSEQYDPEELSVERFDWSLSSGRGTLTVGDYFANFSQYSMNKGIKGLGYQHNLSDDQNYLRFAMGSFDGQWEYLYDSPDNEPMDRYGGGLRYQFARDDYRLGLNWAYVDDDADDSNRVNETAYKQHVSAFDWEYRLHGFVLSGEHAYSDSELEAVGGSTDEQTGSANRLVLRGRSGPVKLRLKLEQVTPEFITMGGGATADRRRIYLKGDTKIQRFWRLFASFDQYRNNLDDDLSSTRRVDTEEVGVTRRRAFDRKNLRLSLSLRRKANHASDDSVDLTSYRVKFAASDRFAKVIRAKANIESLLDEDDAAASNSKRQSLFYRLQLSSRHRLPAQWDFRPIFEVAQQESENPTTGGDDVSSLWRLSLRGQKRGGSRLGLDAEQSSTEVDDPNGNDSDRQRYLLFWQAKPSWLSGVSNRLELSWNEYDFDDSSQDYEETVIKYSLRYEFSQPSGRHE